MRVQCLYGKTAAVALFIMNHHDSGAKQRTPVSLKSFRNTANMNYSSNILQLITLRIH